MPIILPITAPSAPGATTNFSEWYREILPDCPGLSLDFALHHIRNAAIDFCTRTWVWRYADTGTMVATTATYAIASPAGSEVTGVLWVKAQNDVNGDEETIGKATYRQVIHAPAQAGAPYAYTLQRYDDITFYPTPDDTYDYSIWVALRPTSTATDIDSDVFVKYRDGIAHGALARLLAMGNKPWSDPAGSTVHATEYMRAIRNAKIELNRDYVGDSLIADLDGGSF